MAEGLDIKSEITESSCLQKEAPSIIKHEGKDVKLASKNGGQDSVKDNNKKKRNPNPSRHYNRHYHYYRPREQRDWWRAREEEEEEERDRYRHGNPRGNHQRRQRRKNGEINSDRKQHQKDDYQTDRVYNDKDSEKERERGSERERERGSDREKERGSERERERGRRRNVHERGLKITTRSDKKESHATKESESHVSENDKEKVTNQETHLKEINKDVEEEKEEQTVKTKRHERRQHYSAGKRHYEKRDKYVYKVFYKKESEDNDKPQDETKIFLQKEEPSVPKTTREIKRNKMATVISSSTQSEELSQQLLGGVYECSICCGNIKHYQEVWSCKCCYHIFHLRCIRRWAHSVTAVANEEHPEEGWRCPCCQNVSTIIPSAYTCFCGRILNPNQSRKRGDLSVPHSCGEPCQKRLAVSSEAPCQHKCPQLCHPGPCPPCPVMVTRKCPCGQKSSRVRCSQYDELPSCGQICGKLLNCGLHYCTQVCHQGMCEECQVTVEKRCFCTKGIQSMKCGQLVNYSCGKMCNKPLTCGNHTCESPCHEGECLPCSLQPEKVSHCPCGATPLTKLLPVGVVRTSCLDDVPVCQNKCSKPLPCSLYSDGSLHYCPKYCHPGACPPCTLTSLVHCKCGKTTQKVACSQADQVQGYTCNRNCGKKLSCGHHRCQNKCCVSDTHTCERICGRKHDCGKHSCQDTCHPGRCGPCWNISYEELTCHCGNEVMLPPIPCGTAPPTCNRPCARVHSCNHPVAHTCHAEETCPPCTYLTDKMCMGNHIMRNYIPCHLKDVSCGKRCGRPLSCDMHNCRKVCHKGDCENEGEVCTQPCTKERKYCSHLCGEQCHVGKDCPDKPCKAKVVIKCGCGRRKEEVVCLASGSSLTSQTFHKLYSGDLSSLMREIQSGQSVKIDSVTMKTAQERCLECDEECAQTERNKKLAEALELTDVDHSPNTPPSYNTFLLEQGKIDINLVLHIEEEFKKLIQTAKEKGTTTSHHFKPMKHTQRRLVHELAEMYSLNSVSYDAEPNRNVVVMATKKSVLPYQTLSQTVSQVKIMPAPVKKLYSPPSSSLTPQTKNDEREEKVAQPDYFNDSNL